MSTISQIRKKQIGILVSVVLVGVGIGHLLFPPKPQVKIEERTVTRTVVDTKATIKAVEAERRRLTAQYEQQRIKDYTRLPDGTIRVHETIETKKQTDVQADIRKHQKQNLVQHTTQHQDQTRVVSPILPRYSIEILAGKPWKNGFSQAPFSGLNYTANVSLRVIGGIWCGVFATRDKQIGVSGRVEF